VFSDSRLLPLLQLWPPEFLRDLLPVLVVRNPVTVAEALHESFGVTIQQGLAMWEIYTSLILASVEGLRVMTLNLDQIAETSELNDRLAEIIDGLHISASPHVLVSETQARELVPEPSPADREFEAYPTAHQLRLWEFLSELKTGPMTLTTAREFREPSAVASETMRWAADSVELHRVHAISLSELGAAQLELREKEIEAEGLRDQLRHARMEAEAGLVAIQEREETIRAGVRTLNETSEMLNALSSELHHQVVESSKLAAEIQDIKNSATWRAGRAAVAPIRLFRSLARTAKRK
jgi:hypothetical protein